MDILDETFVPILLSCSSDTIAKHNGIGIHNTMFDQLVA